MTTPQQISADRIADLVRDRGREFGLVPAGDTSVTHLGAGESYDAWRIAGWTTPDGDGAVIRVVRRPVSELPRPMADEFAFLRLVPPDLGSQGVHLNESPDDLGAPFMIVTLVPGAVVRPGDWTPDLVAAHARQLARLHALPAPAAPGHPISFVRFCADSQGWWESAHPDVTATAAPTLRALARAAQAAEPAFVGVVGDRLIHGDGIVPNILVADGVPRYVDWEWAEYGDPARDLALFGGAVALGPWYAPLPPADLRAFVATYAAAAGRDDADALLVRQRAWEAADRTFFALHLRLLESRGRSEAGVTSDAMLAAVDEVIEGARG